METVEIYDSARLAHPMVEEFKAVIRYRDLIYQLVAKSIKTRYKRSILGIGWTMLNPLLTMLVLTLVFSSVFKFSMEHFAVYLLTGLTIWNFFSQTTMAAIGEMVYGGDLFGRIYFPKSVFTISSVGTGLVNLIFAFGPLLLIMLFLGVPIRPAALLSVFPVIAAALFSLGVGLFLSAGAAYFADLLPIYEVILMIWFYVTPIIYPPDILPASVSWIVRFNPMAYIVEAFRKPLFEGSPPDITTVGIAFAFGFLALIPGWWFFSKHASEYAYRV